MGSSPQPTGPLFFIIKIFDKEIFIKDIFIKQHSFL